MSDSIQGFGASSRINRDPGDSAPQKYKAMSSKQSKPAQHVDDDSSTRRVDQTAWDVYFAELMKDKFVLFQNQETYQKYIQASRKSLDASIASEREDQRMRERWDGLRDAFRDAFEKVLVEQEVIAEEVEEEEPPEVHSAMSFHATPLTSVEGADVKVSLLYLKTEGLFPKAHHHTAALRLKEDADNDFEEHSWRSHRIHWLIIDRKARHTKRDSLDILAEAA
ncbi:MAG: hypothetical protein Q8K75_07300 [Chlamydiales bacterium]|nr:hypothetical protein [Chlamydiales bacterium]